MEYKTGTRVIVNRCKHGRIIGEAWWIRGDENKGYLVDLDNGFYDPKEEIFVSILVCLPGSVKLEEG